MRKMRDEICDLVIGSQHHSLGFCFFLKHSEALLGGIHGGYWICSSSISFFFYTCDGYGLLNNVLLIIIAGEGNRGDNVPCILQLLCR